MAKTTRPSRRSTAILDEHLELRRRNDQLRHFLRKPRPRAGSNGSYRWASSLSEHLLGIHNRLAEHFHDEELCGLFRELRERYPSSASRIERLLDQHSVLLDDLRQLLDNTLLYAEGREPKNARLRRATESFLNRLRRHEDHELEFRQRLYSQDLGTGD